MVRILQTFWFKLVFLSTLIFIWDFSYTQIYNQPPQIIDLCDVEFITKKYSVLYLPGYSITWIINDQINIEGNLNSDIIYIKWETPGNYSIIAQYSNGECISQNELNVVVKGCPDVTLYIPNSFTPNGDGNNEVFGAYGVGVKKFNMVIFNRWGEKIFESFSIENRWNGFYQNSLCQEGVYVYQIYYQGEDLKTKIIYGKISLIK
jgi:gliding motility-associated-like protein